MGRLRQMMQSVDAVVAIAVSRAARSQVTLANDHKGVKVHFGVPPVCHRDFALKGDAGRALLEVSPGSKSWLVTVPCASWDVGALARASELLAQLNSLSVHTSLLVYTGKLVCNGGEEPTHWSTSIADAMVTLGTRPRSFPAGLCVGHARTTLGQQSGQWRQTHV